MQNKIKKIVSLIIIGLSISNSHAQNVDKPLAGIGLGFMAKLSNPTFILNSLETNPEATTNYFEKNPLNHNPVAKVLIPRLKTAQTEEEYDKLYRIAELMGIMPIPPYTGKKNKPTVYINPQNEINQPTKYTNPNMEGESGSNIIYTPKGNKFDTSTRFPNDKPMSWDEYLILISHSQELGNNLEDWYRLSNPNWTRPANVAAHHIVPATHKAAQQARLILIKYYGIDGFNNAMNGVYLPTYKEPNPQSIVHNGKHPDIYVQKINDIIVDAEKRGGKQEVEKELNRARNLLQNSPPGTDWSKVL